MYPGTLCAHQSIYVGSTKSWAQEVHEPKEVIFNCINFSGIEFYHSLRKIICMDIEFMWGLVHAFNAFIHAISINIID